MTPEKIAQAMAIWSAALIHYPLHQQIPELLAVALTKDREHFDKTALWLFDENEQLFIEAIAVARHMGILRNWDDVEASGLFGDVPHNGTYAV